MRTHQLLEGGHVSLANFTKRQIAFIERLQRMGRRGVSYFDIEQTAVGPGSLSREGEPCITYRIIKSPIYVVARDIATRIGIEQGLILHPVEHEEFMRAERAGRLVSVAVAAKRVGISTAAFSKVIGRGALKPVHIGKLTLLREKAVQAYANRRRARAA